MACQIGKYHKSPWRVKGKNKGGSISIQSDNRVGDTISLDQMISAQPGYTPQVTWALTDEMFWATTVFVDHFSDYLYIRIMRITLDKYNFQSKEDYQRLVATHGTRFFAYRADNERCLEPRFKE